MRYKFIISVFLLVIAGILFYFFPRHSCCEDDEKAANHSKLVVQSLYGDVASTKEIFLSMHNRGHDNEARQWALIGAMQGDVFLAEQFKYYYIKASPEQRETDLIILKKNLDKKIGARNLLEELKSLD